MKMAMKDSRAEVKKVCAELPKRHYGGKKSKGGMGIIQRMEMREKMMAAQLAALQKFHPAFTNFYNSLSEKQRRGLGRLMPRGGRNYRR